MLNVLVPKGARFVCLLSISLGLSMSLSSASVAQESEPMSFAPIQDEGTIFFLTPGQSSVRWVRHDTPSMRAALARIAPNMTLEVLDAAGDSNKQQTQVEAAIASGAKGIVVVVVDGANAGGILQAAKANDVPVVGYGHDIMGENLEGLLSAHITTLMAENYHVPHCVYVGKKVAESDEWTAADPFKLALFNIPTHSGTAKIAYQNCMAGLKPAIDAGKLKIVCEQALPDYTGATAQKATEQCLTSQANDVDGFSVGNDDQADGIYAALAAQELQGKTIIYGGYDATLTGLQRVLLGYQDFDTYPPFREMGSVAVQALLSKVNSAVPMPKEVNTRYLNAQKVAEGGVPAAFLPDTRAFADTIEQTVIADSLFTKEQLCTGMASAADFCKK